MASDKQPLVSVCIPSYNHGAYIAQAIESIIDQSYPNWELIIVDDCSPDDSAKVIRGFQERLGGRMRAVFLESNVGISEVVNRYLMEVRGDYIAALSSDDVMDTQRLEKQVRHLEQNPQIAAVFTNVRHIDAQGNPVEVQHDVFARPWQNLRLQLLHGNFLNGPSVMVRSEVFRAVGAHNPALDYVQDFDFWLRMLDDHDFAKLDEPLTYYRVHGKNQSVHTVDTQPAACLYETAVAIISAIERWPVERIFRIDAARDSDEWRVAVAQAKAKLAEILLHNDQRYFGRPFLGLGKAYSLMLEAVRIAPRDAEVREMLRRVYRALGDEPRSRGEKSVLAWEWLREPVDAAPQARVAQPTAQECYGQWIAHNELRECDGQIMAERMMQQWGQRPAFHLITVLQPGQEAYLGATLSMLQQQLYPGWGWSVLAAAPAPDGVFDELPMIEWIEVRDDFSAVLADTLRTSQADWIGVIDAGDRLAAHALIRFGDYADKYPQWQMIYVDEDRIDEQGERSHPRFKPDFNVDLLRSTPYMGTFALVRREALLAAGGIRWLAEIGVCDLALRIVEQWGEGAIGHIADVLHHRHQGNDARYDRPMLERQAKEVLAEHFARTGVNAEIRAGYFPLSFNVEYLHETQPLVSIIIPTRDHPKFIVPCVDSILERTRYDNYEIIIVDNNTRDPVALDYLAEAEARNERVRVLRYPHDFNYSAMNNLAAREARGEYLLLLNNDTVVVQEAWLERMLSHGQRPDVGVVGARLVFPDQRLQHAGVVVGISGTAHHVGIGSPLDEPGYLGRAQTVQNYSAVTGACLLVRKSVFEAVGGLNEQDFKVLFNDVDLCLRIREAGLKVVWTPFATVVHHGSGTLLGEMERSAQASRTDEARTFVARWSRRYAADPAYNRNLTLRTPDWSVETEVVGHWDTEFHDRLRVLAAPVNASGSPRYRVLCPLLAMEHAAMAQIGILPEETRGRVPTVWEVERLEPDTLLAQMFIHDHQLNALRQYRSADKLLTVFALDDLVTDVPDWSPFAKQVYPDVERRLRAALHMSDRLIVSTEPLRDAYRGWIDDIRVVPNYLERRVWGELRSRRRQGDKPRVGWAGAQQHQGDLALLFEVVAATADEIDWIFMGMWLEEFEPYVKEFHQPVPFEEYPTKLATLDLDLAVAPLALHPFNEAKSNLRLLEFGALGWPVVCSDIEPYRGAPVCRVANDAQAWIGALRRRIHDWDAMAAEGDRLREWVHRHWMLEDHLDEWLAALDQQRSQPVARAASLI